MGALRMVALVLLTMSLPLGVGRAADEAVQASGHWEGSGLVFDIAGAYAYPAPVGFDNLPGTRVAISNYEFYTEGINRLFNREQWIVKSFADDQTAVVYLHFDRSGKYVGMSWYFGSGRGCGFCFSTDTRSIVKRSGERLAGTVSHSDEDVSFTVSFDVPIAPSAWGEPLPEDGGEPGKAYLAYLRALDEWDAAALRPFMMPDDQERADQAAAEGVNIAQAFAESFYPQKAKFVRGSVDGDWAQVLVKGESSWGGEAHGEAIMNRVDGTWRMWLDQAEVGDWPDHLRP